MQAIHDIQTYRWDLSKYDHLEFPGAVKRSFIPSLFIAVLSYIPSWFVNPLLAARWTIGYLSWESMNSVSCSISKRFGTLSGALFILFSCAQFHLMYYMSRPLSNIFGLIATNHSLSLLLKNNYYGSISILVFAAAIVRSEIALLLMCLILPLLLQRRITLSKLLLVGISSSLVAVGASFLIDSYFWGAWCWPELEAFLFNVVEGKSSDWGTSPFYYYFVRLPWLFLNPTTLLFLLISFVYIKPARLLIYVPLFFIFVYSFLGHKEWRFIIYSIPWFNAASAIGASLCFNASKFGKKISEILRLMFFSGIIFGFIGSSFLLYVFQYAYPGGLALTRLYEIENHPQVSVHMDVYPCMTGITRFSQLPSWYYDKTEDPKMLSNSLFISQFDYLITEDPESYNDTFDVIESVNSNTKIPILPKWLSNHIPREISIRNPAQPVYILANKKARATKPAAVDDYSSFIGHKVDEIKLWPPIYRVVSPDTLLTRDYREDRLNFFIDKDQILTHITQG
ncbi:putative Dol-P-Man:Man(7)GlcNAc(2)-PP-Dol alpha-1,6-mannosyltransferase [Schizosaccharomyces pombe]